MPLHVGQRAAGWVHQRFVTAPVHLAVRQCACLFAFTCTRMHFVAQQEVAGRFLFFFYIFTVVFVACGAVVNVAHVVYVTFLIPTLQRRTFLTINAHLSYTCINCRAARADQRSRPEAKQQDRQTKPGQ